MPLPAGAVRQPRAEETNKPLVLLGMPSYDGKAEIASVEACLLHATLGACSVAPARTSGSFLTKVFNSLWCAALNARKQGVTHFAMCHADIIPAAPGWLDVLLGEMNKHDADMVSAVSPIKNDAGLTSTSVALDLADPWLSRRLTMREVFELPETFGSADVGGPLLLNTGLFVCRLDRPWVDAIAEDMLTTQVCFDFKNRIVRDPHTGEFHAEAISEDWLFSQEANRRGAKLMATRRVVVRHVGDKEYSTDRAWGAQSTDDVFHRLNEERVKRASQVHAGLQGQGC
jgi:hypothetical protein